MRREPNINLLVYDPGVPDHHQLHLKAGTHSSTTTTSRSRLTICIAVSISRYAACPAAECIIDANAYPNSGLFTVGLYLRICWGRRARANDNERPG
jgi:hypothetical protein